MDRQALLFPDGGRAEQALLDYARALPEPSKEPSLIDKIMAETTIGQMITGAGKAMTLPGDVYAGRVDPKSDEGIGRAFDLAGLVTGGAGMFPSKSANELRAGFTAYHGSPHDFSQFSASKIGTGEGAQSYGHGLYFAENKAVAEKYRDALSTTQRPKNITDPAHDIAQDWIADFAGDRAAAAKAVLEYTGGSKDGKAIADYILKPAGHIYEVKINADLSKMLDWENMDSAARAAVRDPAHVKKLASEGIPGIRYRDAGSRGGEGASATSNYVVFDDKLIELMRKYGLAGAAIPAAVAHYDRPDA